MSEKKHPLLELEACVSKLEASDQYKVLRKIPDPKKSKARESADVRYALIVDTETTGLNIRTDEIIELGYVLVAYKGHELSYIKDFGNEMREPDRRIPDVVQALTGITPDMVKGKKLSKEKILSALSVANIVIAHNAAFDRPFCERLLPEFSEKPWACSLTEIPWREYGFESAKLKYLLIESGYFFEGHRALDDCAALEVLLKSASPFRGSFFEELMESARQPSFIFRVHAPYELRQRMTDFGFRWSRFEERAGGEWQKVVRFDEFESEKMRIGKMAREGAKLEYLEQNAFTRYKL